MWPAPAGAGRGSGTRAARGCGGGDELLGVGKCWLRLLGSLLGCRLTASLPARAPHLHWLPWQLNTPTTPATAFMFHTCGGVDGVMAGEDG